ncbi:MAG: hypothetical protein VZR56_11930 [Treponema sp.]|nr:hypothetical protein [Treponema sp.]
MRKNKFLALISSFAIVVASFFFISCEDILNIIFAPLGTLNSFEAFPLDNSAYLTWTNGAISSYSLYLDVSPRPTTGTYPLRITENNNYLMVDNLQNGETYTFTLYLSSNGEVVSSKTATASPSESYIIEPHPYNATSSGSFIEVPANTVAVRITGANGKHISYANVNTSTSSAISATSVRRYASPASAGTISPNVISRSAEEVSEESNTELSAPVIKNFIPPSFSDVKIIGDNSRVAYSSGGSFNPSNPQVGQTRMIYVDQDVNLETYGLESMKLYAIGYKPNGTENEIACLVWARQSDVDDSSRDSKISLGVIRDITEKFVKYYQFEERIFGGTYNKLYNTGESIPSYVNIVLWDIGKDKTSGNCGVVGYFWAKDYYKNMTSGVRNSNEGKFFYIDIPFCNYRRIGNYVSYDGNDNTVSDTVISTLFHEYQHMIDFNTKTINHNITNVDTWYNEMLSMLCEDLMGDALGLEEREKVYAGRIPNFNGYYYYSGAAQYLSSNSWVSYATAYSFGSFLMRNYGGTALVREMSTNPYAGRESVVNAVNAVNGINRTWNGLLQEYIQACAFRAAYAKTAHLPTHNITHTGGTTYNGGTWIESFNVGNAQILIACDTNAFTYDNVNATGGTVSTAVTGLNLWKSSYGNAVSSSTYYGPIPVKIGAEIDVQPTGFVMHSIGKANSNDVTLFFTSSSNSNEKLLVFIQDDYSATTADSTDPESRSN